jgi:hypothetical protein
LFLSQGKTARKQECSEWGSAAFQGRFQGTEGTGTRQSDRSIAIGGREIALICCNGKTLNRKNERPGASRIQAVSPRPFEEATHVLSCLDSNVAQKTIILRKAIQ